MDGKKLVLDASWDHSNRFIAIFIKCRAHDPFTMAQQKLDGDIKGELTVAVILPLMGLCRRVAGYSDL